MNHKARRTSTTNRTLLAISRSLNEQWDRAWALDPQVEQRRELLSAIEKAISLVTDAMITRCAQGLPDVQVRKPGLCPICRYGQGGGTMTDFTRGEEGQS